MRGSFQASCYWNMSRRSCMVIFLVPSPPPFSLDLSHFFGTRVRANGNSSIRTVPVPSRKIGGSTGCPHEHLMLASNPLLPPSRSRMILDMAGSVQTRFNGVCDIHIHIQIVSQPNTAVSAPTSPELVFIVDCFFQSGLSNYKIPREPRPGGGTFEQ